MFNKKTKICSLLCTVAMIINLSACSLEKKTEEKSDVSIESSSTENQTNKNYDPIIGEKEKEKEEVINTNDLTTQTIKPLDIKSSNYDTIDLKHSYNSLSTDNQKLLYEQINKSVYTVTTGKDSNDRFLLKTITLKGLSIKQEDILIALEAFTNDNPQVFWVDNFFTYYTTKKTITIQLYSFLNEFTIRKSTSLLKNNIDLIFSVMPEELSQYERELYLHNALLKNCTYDDKTAQGEGKKSSYTAYGALVNDTAVCEGYSKAMQLLLKYCGVESTLVNGKHDDVWHQWNVVKLGEEWYHLDATWDDSDEHIHYNYFNLTTDQILNDRTISDNYTNLTAKEINGSTNTKPILFNINIPNCFSNKHNFYVKEAVLYKNSDHKSTKEIENKLVDTIIELKNTIYIKVSNDSNYKETVNKLFFNEPYVFFNCADNVNKYLDYAKIDLDDISIIKRPEHRIIEVFFNYN